MSEGIIVINAGSSSVKFSLFLRHPGHEPQLQCVGQVEGINAQPHFIVKSSIGDVLAERRWEHDAATHEELFEYLLGWVESHLGGAKLVAAGHRVVHGGMHHSKPALVDDALIAELEQLVPLAPLHQPHNLDPIRAIARLHPGLPQVACFDTAFHRTNPWITQTFALPQELTDEGVRRYGFHGLSYQYISRKLTEIDPAMARGKVIALHIGSGASLCAMKDGVSFASTMGFTALDGLVMGTRPGVLDAGVVLYLMDHKKMTSKEIETLLYKKSGLLGVSGISPDMRDLIGNSEPRAQQAVELFIHRLCREMGSLAAAMEGLDGLVFTAGVGEHSPYIRKEICDRLKWMGVDLDIQANEHNHSLIINTIHSQVKIFIIPTNEELMIALGTEDVVFPK